MSEPDIDTDDDMLYYAFMFGIRALYAAHDLRVLRTSPTSIGDLLRQIAVGADHHRGQPLGR